MCCGNNRKAMTGTETPSPAPTRHRPTSAPASQPSGGQPPRSRPVASRMLKYEYIGRTSLTVTSPVTNRRYLFDKPGAQLAVDARDRAIVAAIPVLKLIR